MIKKMEDIKAHKQAFDDIIKRYNLSDDQKAGEVADFLTKQKETVVSIEEFSKYFAMEEDDARIFLSFIMRGIRFKEDNLDNPKEL